MARGAKLSDLFASDLEAAFEYVDAYRDHGNPIEAGLKFYEMFGWKQAERVAVMSAWMKTFDPALSAEDRVYNAILAERDAL